MSKFVLPKCPYCGREMKKMIVSIKAYIYGGSEKASQNDYICWRCYECEEGLREDYKV